MSDFNAVESTPSGGDTSAPAVPAAPATPQAAPQAPATGAPSTPNDNLVPSYRIRETREAAQREYQTQLQARENEWKQRYDQVQSQVRALVGVQPNTQNPEVEQIKSQFFKVFPEAKALLENSQRIQEVLERSGDYDAVMDQTWRSYGRQVTDRLFSKTSEALGEPLNDDGKRFIHKAFVSHIQNSPENYARYQQDPTIVDDFVKEITGFVNPIRRTQTAGIPARASVPLPQDSAGGMPRQAGAPQPKDLDERMDRGWALYNTLAKGGQQ